MLEWLPTAAAVFFVRLIMSSKSRETVRYLKGNVIFPAMKSLRYLLNTAIICMAAGFIQDLLLTGWDNINNQRWSFAFVMTLAIGAIFIRPGTLMISEKGVSYHNNIGFKKQILWEEIWFITSYPYPKEVLVQSKNGVRIKHTCLHVDQNRFLLEVKARMKQVKG